MDDTEFAHWLGYATRVVRHRYPGRLTDDDRQDLAVIVLDAIHSYDPDRGPLSTHVAYTVRYRWVDLLRVRLGRRSPRPVVEPDAELDRTTPDHAPGVVERVDVQHLLRCLSRPERAAVVDTVMAGRSIRSVARERGCDWQSIRRLQARALDRLRQHLEVA